MAAVTYLLDKSAWMQTTYCSDAAQMLAGLIRKGGLALCTVTAMEILHSARNGEEYSRDYSRLTALPWVDLSVPRRAALLQRELATRGWHRMPIPDVVIAATAAEHNLTVLHYDADYEKLSTVAGCRHEWIIPRTTGHGHVTATP